MLFYILSQYSVKWIDVVIKIKSKSDARLSMNCAYNKVYITVCFHFIGLCRLELWTCSWTLGLHDIHRSVEHWIDCAETKNTGLTVLKQ